MCGRNVKLGFVLLTTVTIFLYLLLPENGNTLESSNLAHEIVRNLDAIRSSFTSRAVCLANACYHMPSTSSGQFFETVFQICLSSQFVVKNNLSVKKPATSNIHMVVVACGDRLEETLVNIKTSVLFCSERIVFHIFAEEDLHAGFREGIEEWPDEFRQNLDYILYPITFPNDGNSQNWKTLFKPCASQRLFLPLIMDKSVDSVLYVDTDILFISDVRKFWDLFKEFNSTQLSSLCNEHEDKRMGWYNRFARHPYYGETGVNSGVMLMNLTRMRKVKYKNDLISAKMKWGEMLLPLYKKYKYNITWGDQDLLNIVFHYNPEMLHMFPCKWNYRPDHCMYGQMCKSAQKEGVQTVHGSRSVYHNEKQPTFKAVYLALKQYNFQDDLTQHLFKVMKDGLRETENTYCGKGSHLILNGLMDTVNQTMWRKRIKN